MSGSCTTKTERNAEHGYSFLEWNWIADSSENVSEVGSIGNVFGRIEQVRFIPDADPDVPTNAYDVTLLDQYGADILMGTGANVSNSRSNTALNIRTPLNADQSYIYLHNATLTPAISNAGNVKKGTIQLVLR